MWCCFPFRVAAAVALRREGGGKPGANPISSMAATLAAASPGPALCWPSPRASGSISPALMLDDLKTFSSGAGEWGRSLLAAHDSVGFQKKIPQDGF